MEEYEKNDVIFFSQFSVFRYGYTEMRISNKCLHHISIFLMVSELN